jgi:uncharacterized membrane protein
MHALFALFDKSQDAVSAAKALKAMGAEDHHCTIMVHTRSLEREPASEIELFETAAASTTARVAVLGSIIGAVLGTLLFGPLGLIGAGRLAAVLFGAAVGAGSGALTGALAGPSDMDPELKKLAEEVGKGKTLLAVEPPSLECMGRAEEILRDHHAHVVHRHLLRPMTAQERDVDQHT